MAEFRGFIGFAAAFAAFTQKKARGRGRVRRKGRFCVGFHGFYREFTKRRRGKRGERAQKTARIRGRGARGDEDQLDLRFEGAEQVIFLINSQKSRDFCVNSIKTAINSNSLKQKELQAVQRKKQAFLRRNSRGDFPNNVSETALSAEINKLEAEILQFEREMVSQGKGRLSGCAFVSFRNETMKQLLISRYKVSSLQRFCLAFGICRKKLSESKKNSLIFKGNRLFLSPAAEPSDVYWGNLHLSDKERYLRKFLGYVFSVLLLVLCALVIYYLLITQSDLNKEIKKNKENKEDELKVQVLTGLLGVVIVIINKILCFVIPKIAA